jgi:hypothetical protein
MSDSARILFYTQIRGVRRQPAFEGAAIFRRDPKLFHDVLRKVLAMDQLIVDHRNRNEQCQIPGGR